MSPLARTLLLLGLALPSPALAQAPPNCSPEWIRSYGGYPFAGSPDGTLNALVEHDDGHGRALIAGGHFAASSSDPNFVAKWDGWGWTHVGPDFDGATTVRALCVFDDGSGPALYAAGDFTVIGGVVVNHVAKWNGTSWSALGTGTSSNVNALLVFDDGSGPALYVGGDFTSAGGAPANHIARWNGSAWSTLGAGAYGSVLSLGAYDAGGGPALYVGGGFTTAGSVPAHCVARWDGANWSALGSGTTAQVKSFAVYDDGTGSALYAGGMFDHAGGIPADHIARWNGSNWSALPVGTSNTIHSLLVYDDGSGPALFAAGTFSYIGGQQVNDIAKWNGASWIGLGSGVWGTNPGIYALCSFDDGHGVRLCAAGHFTTAGPADAINHAAWNGQSWEQIGFGLDGGVHSTAMYDDGTGPALYALGDFRHAGASEARCIAKWTGSRWQPLVLMPLYGLNCGAVYDDGSGPALFVGGSYGLWNLAKWDGANWSFPAGGAIGNVYSLLVFDDGTGPALYSAAGTTGTASVSVAKWNGVSWTALGSGMNGAVLALSIFDDGSGPALYAGGNFTTAGGAAANGIARWNGSTWTALGSGVGGPIAVVHALAVFDDGSGPGLCAGGSFDTAGGSSANSIARWNGANWSALGSGLVNGPYTAEVRTLVACDAGIGPALYVGGFFSAAGGVPSTGLANWNGSSWSDMSLGFPTTAQPWVRGLTAIDDGSPTGPALLVEGYFTGSPAGDGFLTKWDFPIECTEIGTVFCLPGSGSVMPCPCFNPAVGLRRGCDNSSATGGAQLYVTGSASLSNDLVRLTTSDERPSALSVFLQGTNTIQNGVAFGQGVRCVAGALTRLYAKSAVNGSALAPEPNDATVSARSVSLGDPIVAGQHRYYGVYYRDPSVLGGCSAASTFNITQQVDLLWAP